MTDRQPSEESPRVRMAFIGCGGMARSHARRILQQQDTTEIRVVGEPSGVAYEAFCELFEEVGAAPPPNQPDLERLLQEHELDAAFIITPHVLHFPQAKACLEAGLECVAGKTDGDECRRGPRAHRRSEAQWSPALCGLQRQHVSAGCEPAQTFCAR